MDIEPGRDLVRRSWGEICTCDDGGKGEIERAGCCDVLRWVVGYSVRSTRMSALRW